MRPWLMMLAIAGCGESGSIDEDLPPFDPSAVIYADGCGVLPEAQACVDANPKTFELGDAPQVSEMCLSFGYTCCDPSTWIGSAAAQCIAEQDARVVDFTEKVVDLSCIADIAGATYGVYDLDASPSSGLGVHVATGRVIWFDDGSGAFS
jgi:hypothetical protein